MIKLSADVLLPHAKCTTCALGSCGQPKVGKTAYGRGNQAARIAIVGESPTDLDVKRAYLFSGSSGSLLDIITPGLGIHKDDIYYTNALLCNYPQGMKPTKTTIDACKERLNFELRSLPNLKVVIALGSIPLQALTPATAITKEIYNVYWNADIGAFVIPTYSPGFCFKNIEAYVDLVWAFARALDLLDKTPACLELPKIRLRIARSTGEAEQFLLELLETRTPTWTAIDWETDYADPDNTPTLAMGYANRDGEATIIPWVSGTEKPEVEDLNHDLVPTQRMINMMARIARNDNIKTIFHNGDFDVRVMRANTGALFRIDYDTMLSDYALDERGGDDDIEGEGKGGSARVGSHRLKSSAKRYLNAPDWEVGLKTYKKSKSTKYSNIPRPILYTYLGYDVYYTRLLRAKHEELLLAEEPSRHGYWTPQDRLHKLLIPAVNEIVKLETGGILINRASAATVLDEMDEQLGGLRIAIHEDAVRVGWPADKEFNPRSNFHKKELFYDIMGIKVTKDLKTNLKGQAIDSDYPVGKDTCTKLRDVDPMFMKFVDFITLDKIRGTYVVSIIENSQVDGNVHGQFLMSVVKTGRLASRDPNMQNIPPRTKVFYEPDDGCTFVNADYKQLEVRVAAAYSRDPKLIAFCRGDIHGSLAKEIYAEIYRAIDQCNSIEELRELGRKYTLCAPMINKIDGLAVIGLTEYKDALRDQLREAAKPVIFGVIYGREAYSLANGPLRCSVPEAQKYIDNLFTKFSKLAAWLDGQKKEVVKYGWIESVTGQRRRFPFTTDDVIRRILKQSVNAPVQGFGSDICLTGFVNVAPILREMDLGRPLILVHDAIGFSIPTAKLDIALPIIKREMETAYVDPEVRYEVDFKIGPNYGTLTKKRV